MNQDSKQQIDKCLSCEKASCTNCIEYGSGKRRTKTVIRYGNGEEKRYSSPAEAAAEMFVGVRTIRAYASSGQKRLGYYWRYEE